MRRTFNVGEAVCLRIVFEQSVFQASHIDVSCFVFADGRRPDVYKRQDKENMRLMEKIFKNQRRIIKEVTGKAPEKRPQVWALYKDCLLYTSRCV